MSFKKISLLLFLLFFITAGCGEDKEKVKTLIKDLGNSTNMQVANKAISELVAMGEPVVPSLIDEIQDDNATRRKNIAYVLGKIGSSKAVYPLITLLDDEDYNVRDAAAMALGQIGDKEALPALKKALEKEKNSKVVKYLEKAIEKLEK